jgi:CRP-like cAMP-binding protein
MVPVDALRRIEILTGLTDEQLAQVASICQVVAFKAQEIVVHEGEPSDDMYIIHRGSVEIVLAKGRGTAEASASAANAAKAATAIVSLGQGQVFGEMALIDRGPRSATVRCTADDAQLYRIKRDDFAQLCEHDTGIGYKVMRNLAADLSFKLRHSNLSWK